MISETRIWRETVRAFLLLMFAVMADAAYAQPASSARQETRTGRAEANAIKHVDDAIAVVKAMAAEPGMAKLLAGSRGVFIVPSYGRAALGLGASGGAGVLLVRRSDGSWSDPAFFNIGGLSLGAQVGVEGGPIAMALMNDKAIENFRKKNNFSLNADAGLTVVSWNKMAQGSAGAGDVVVWSSTKGLFGNVATVAVNDIRYNEKATQAYFNQPVTAQDVIDGKAVNPHAEALKKTLAGIAAR